MAKRDTTRYELYDKRKKVYVGITDDPERRKQEHTDEGKRFKSMKIVGPKVSRKSALDWERETIEKYKRRHGSKPPKYNDA